VKRGDWARVANYLGVACTLVLIAVVAIACAPVASSDGGAPVASAASPSISALATAPPSSPTSTLPTLPPRSALERVPTRVRVDALRIDLPVIVPPSDPNHYPFCGVAEFIDQMSRPGWAGTTYLYAHARTGMFLSILDASRTADGKAMLGLTVEIFTSDDRLFTYQVTEVRRHVTSIDFAYRATVEQLILQTSEGPYGTPGKVMLIARPVGESSAAHGDAHPTAHPTVCGPA
jgi:hypothetical protein